MRLPLLNGKKKDEVKKVRKIEKQEIRKFSIEVKRVKSAADISKSLSALSFPKISWADKKRTLVCEIVESEDLQKNPYLFMRLELKPERIEVTYSVTPEVNAKKREIDVCRLLLNVLALSNAYEAGVGALYGRIANALESAVEFATSDYEIVKNKHDELAGECGRLRKKCAELASVNEKQSKLLLESEKRAETLGERVARLESMSDDALMEELYSWISSHSGEIDASEFARVHGVSSARVEEGLDKLLKGGFIARDAA
ncbi:MAG: hypothetical protein AB1468_06610 [Candidatus Micrarchaeota archaeon]